MPKMLSTTAVVALLRPFILMVFLGLVVLPFVLLVRRFMPDGPLKRFLFKKRTSVVDMPWFGIPALLQRRHRPGRK